MRKNVRSTYRNCPAFSSIQQCSNLLSKLWSQALNGLKSGKNFLLPVAAQDIVPGQQQVPRAIRHRVYHRILQMAGYSFNLVNSPSGYL